MEEMNNINEEDYPTKKINVVCSQILSRDTEVESQYNEYKDELVDVVQDYYNQHETPLSLIDKFCEILENKEFPKDIDYWKRECKYWCNDETYIEES